MMRAPGDSRSACAGGVGTVSPEVCLSAYGRYCLKAVCLAGGLFSGPLARQQALVGLSFSLYPLACLNFQCLQL